MPRGTASSVYRTREARFNGSREPQGAAREREGRAGVAPTRRRARLATLPYEDLGFAKVDHHRALRRGFPEAVFGAGKTPEQVVGDRRADRRARPARARHPHDRRRPREAWPPCAPTPAGTRRPAASRSRRRRRPPLPGRIAVLAAGTSDLPVAEEAAVVADVPRRHGRAHLRRGRRGPAPAPRPRRRRSAQADVVDRRRRDGGRPALGRGRARRLAGVAVPTSVGYGASFHGLAALLAMLNSCSSGVGVVNIDNGFGAAHLACLILSAADSGRVRRIRETLPRSDRALWCVGHVSRDGVAASVLDKAVDPPDLVSVLSRRVPPFDAQKGLGCAR